MKLPNHPLLPLLAIGLIAYLSGDLTAAIVERQFQARPQRRNASPSTTGVVLNGIKLPGELQSLLTSQNPQEQLSVDNTTMANISATQAPPGVVTGAPPAPAAAALPQLAGTLEGQGQALAVLQMGSETQVVPVGDQWMGFTVLEVSSFQARIRDARGQESTISMALANVTQDPPPQPVAAPNAFPPPVALNAPALNNGPLTQREIRSILDNKEGWIKNVLVQPIDRQGEPVGVKIAYAGMDNPFPRLGILSGDVVMSLNGKPLHGMGDFQDAYMTLRNSSTLNFEVERNGQKMPITVTLPP